MKALLSALVILITISIQAQETELIVKLTTGRKKHSGTNNLRIYAQINDSDEFKYILNDPNKNDFETGATDTFEGLMFDIPLKEVKKITIGTESGNDAWLLRQLEYQFKQGDLKSKFKKCRTKTWISAEKSDKGSKLKKTFYIKKKIVLK